MEQPGCTPGGESVTMGFKIWGREDKYECSRECRVVMGRTLLYWRKLITNRRFAMGIVSGIYWDIREAMPHVTHEWAGGWRQTLHCYQCYE